jgi:hypothetical protein
LGSQAEEQINGLSDVVTGLTKRPPTEHLADIIGDLSTSKIHTYKRDENEQYTVMVSDGAIRVLNQNGVELDVELDVDNEGVPYTYDYISGINAEQDIRITSIADFSFILNTKKVVLKSDEIFPAERPNEALVYLKQVNYEREYSLRIDTDDSGTVTYGGLTSSTTTGDNTSGANLQNSLVVEELRRGLKSDTDSESVTFSKRTEYQGGSSIYAALRTYQLTSVFLPTDLSRISVTTTRLLKPSEYTIDTVNDRIIIDHESHITYSARKNGSIYRTPVVKIHKAATDDTSTQEDFSIDPPNYNGKEPMFVVNMRFSR